MTLDKKTRERLLAHCGEIHEDDCIDPRQYFKRQPPEKKNDYKTQQLCRQVLETISLVLSGEIEDERLQGLQVLRVEPAPDASQLAVTLQSEKCLDHEQFQNLQDRLGFLEGRLRCEVAGAISRKRTPRLVFRLANSSSNGGGAQ